MSNQLSHTRQQARYREMNSITHFSHEHPLYLNQKPAEPRDFYCNACLGELSKEKHSNVYGCELCEFFLHKSCAELPMEIVHKNHLKHSLFKVSKPRHPLHSHDVYQHWDEIGLPFFYYCYLCDFSLDINSAFRIKDRVLSCNKDLTFHHQSHKHPLMVHPRPATFFCDACGVTNKDLFYHCSPCHYLIHKRCAMLPSTTLNDIHEHPLTLSFGFPSQYDLFSYYCDVCGKIVSHGREDWLYYCELCRYFVHIRCMATEKHQIEVDLKGLRTDDMPCLPTNDIYVELIQRFLLTNDSLANIEQEVSVFSHKHPLVYSNRQFLEDENEDGEEEILCDACIEPILNSPCYHCAECRYFLHFNCARLRDELQHPSHQHQLILACHTRFDETFNCNYCKRDCNGFRFCCTTQGCQFNLDLKCAALPKFIKHEYHNHPLFQFSLDRDERCRGCGYTIWKGDVFGCDPCNFNMHPRCIHLPKTLKHRFDSKHPLKLRYPPHAYHPEPFDCYQCDMEIDPNYCLYHCEECDLSLHLDCASIAGKTNNIKFGHKVQIGSHPHALKYVYEASVTSSRCSQCDRWDAYFSLECETCNFRICKACVKKIEILS